MFVVSKLSAFLIEISGFPSPGCCISFILHLLQLVSKQWLNFTGAHLEFIDSRDLNFGKILAHLYQG